MTAGASTLELAIGLGDRARRAATAQALARRLGVEILLFMVRDPVLGTLLPAPGFPQTLPGGRAWRGFLKRCEQPGRCSGEVDLPHDARRRAEAMAVDGAAVILIGGEPCERELAALVTVLPLLAATLTAEQAAIGAQAAAAAATEKADRAQTLARALELSRTEAATLNTELRDEHRRKDEFLAMLAHELRNPLAPLVTSLELLRRHDVEPAMLKKLVAVMARQTAQLKRIVDDLLQVSRLRHGRIALRRERLMLREVIDAAVDESRAVVDAKQQQLEIEGASAALWVTADRVRLTQIFSNLLNNAAKYTDSGGRLTLSVRRENDSAVIDMKDTGVGIASEMLPRIFDLFTQAPVALERSQGGLGIGLTLARKLVELHGGRITVASPGLGLGSTFTVRLPLVAPGTATASPRATIERRERTRLSSSS